ncbi:hypothetical protein N7456_001102 [Penicillium angulare]|uniref:Uncharacterized protein n=1 Tax=Penicillium angulare TaxID=116970 RepID=A0A9W9GDD6_9EURO|nr:hypothetical protein N7456_001102 [Penicillium angulare]
MSYCYGFEKECVADDGSNSTTIQSSITACSDLNPLIPFNPGQAIIEAMGGSVTVIETGFPEYIIDDFMALAPTSQTMAFLYILGTCAVGLSVILRLSTVRYIWQPREPPVPIDGIPPPRYPGYPNDPLGIPPSDLPPSKIQLMSFSSPDRRQISAILLIIASIIATMISSQFVSLISKSGQPTVSAQSSSTFLGMTWTIVVIQVLLASDALIALLRYRARHCRCDFEEIPTAPGPEGKRLFSGYD